MNIDIQKARITLTETTLQELLQAIQKRRADFPDAVMAKVVSPKSGVLFMIQLRTPAQESLGFDLLTSSTDTAEKLVPGTIRSSMHDVPTRGG